MPVIQLEQISKVYGFGNATTIALDDISLNVEKGEFVAIMGPSGSGKSTLLNIIGLLDKASEGTYTLDNKDVSKWHGNKRAKARRDKIGFIFQNFNLVSRMTVIENVALPLAYRNLTTTKRLNRADEIIDKVGLKLREYYMPHQLSGGQAQKVAIARALVNNPSIIIADEPTGNLDTASSIVIMELLKEIHDAENTILMVTHNPDLTAYASRVVYMRDGRIHQDKDLKEHETANIAELHNAPGVDEEKVIAKRKQLKVKKQPKKRKRKSSKKVAKK
jgi:putative ABC transport system ATP-binding protein